MSDRAHAVVAAAGLNHLGGDDFDELLSRLLGGAPLEDCREAKERLSPNARKIVVGEASIPVGDYWEACAPLVDKTLATTEMVMQGDDTLAGIYVVGGASALPVIGRALRERWGRRVHRSPYPFAAVAIGLAIAADETSGFELEDRLSRCFGVFREARGGREVAFDPILGRDAVHDSAVHRVYRAAHNVGHFRFVECGAIAASGAPDGEVTPAGDLLFPFDAALRGGEADLDAVPVVRLDGEGPLVEERYAVDANGIVSVTITDLGSGYRREYRLGG